MSGVDPDAVVHWTAIPDDCAVAEGDDRGAYAIEKAEQNSAMARASERLQGASRHGWGVGGVHRRSVGNHL